MKVTYEEKTRILKIRGNVEDAILKFGVSPQTVLAKLNDEFVPDDEPLKAGDRLQLIRISSIG